MAETVREHFSADEIGLIVPVPVSDERKKERGYNQAAVIAREVARVLEAPCEGRLLRRGRRTRSQAHLRGSEAKAANVAGAFVLRRPVRPEAHHILLIDDVFTTGATLAACHRALRRACGPQVRISIATLAAVGD